MDMVKKYFIFDVQYNWFNSIRMFVC